MFAWTSRGTELQRFARHPMTRVAIVTLILLPLLYGAMYVWAFWSPTDRLASLPVALVNEDSGTTLDGAELNAGNRIVEKLDDTESLGWVKTDAADAAKGVEKGEYYFSVTIPADFSEKIVSAQGEAPQAADIVVNYDDANSFLASLLGGEAMAEIRDVVRETVGDEAVNRLMVGLGDIRDGFGAAADGSFLITEGLQTARDGSATLNTAAIKLNDGALKLKDGSGKLAAGAENLSNGAGKARDGSAQLAAGISQVNAGSAELANGTSQLPGKMLELANGVSQLSQGATRLSDGLSILQKKIPELSHGVTQLSQGAGSLASSLDKYVVGVKQAASGADRLATGAGKLQTGAQQLSTGVTGIHQLSLDAQAALKAGHTEQAITYLQQIQALTTATSQTPMENPVTLADGVQSLSAGAAGLRAGATQLQSGFNNPDPQKGLVAGTQALNVGAKALRDGAAQLNTKLPELIRGEDELANGAEKLAKGTSELNTKMPQLAGGMKKLNSGAAALHGGTQQLNQRAPQLVSGLNSLYLGSRDLTDGSHDLASGTAQLAAGTSELKNKTPELNRGLNALSEGSSELTNKLNEGKNQIPDDSQQVRDQRSQVIAAPVNLDDSWSSKAESWGEGFSPFFISLAMWVGCLITWLLLRPVPKRGLMEGVNGFRLAWGSLNAALTLVVVQVLVMLGVMHYAIGLNPQNVAATVLFTILIGFVWMALQQFLQITFGSAVGKVIIIAGLMLQLASCSGTYPIETEPGFLRAVSPFMPFTYSVEGLRQVITGDLGPRFWACVAILAGIFALSLLGSCIMAARRRTWSMARLHPVIAL